MQELIEALDAELEERKAQEGHGTRVPAALAAYEALDDIREMVKEFAAAWDQICSRCNVDALDPDDEDKTSDFVKGRSSMAHLVLQMIAAAERRVQDR